MTFNINNQTFINYLCEEAIRAGIIVLGNCADLSKPTIIKLLGALEVLNQKFNLNYSCMLSIKKNNFSKPFTGIWKVILAYYKRYAQQKMDKTIIISHESYSEDYAFAKNVRLMHNMDGNNLDPESDNKTCEINNLHTNNNGKVHETNDKSHNLHINNKAHETNDKSHNTPANFNNLTTIIPNSLNIPGTTISGMKEMGSLRKSLTTEQIIEQSRKEMERKEQEERLKEELEKQKEVERKFSQKQENVVQIVPKNNCIDLYPLALFIKNKQTPTYIPKIIRPELRFDLIDKHNSEAEQFFPIDKILQFQKDEFIIIITGPPRCGKTTIANDFLKAWNADERNKYHKMNLIDPNKSEIKKTYKNRMSMLIDGNLSPRCIEFIDSLTSAAKIIFDIKLPRELNMLFNHIAVMNGEDELIPEKRYEIYNIFRVVSTQYDKLFNFKYKITPTRETVALYF